VKVDCSETGRRQWSNTLIIPAIFKLALVYKPSGLLAGASILFCFGTGIYNFPWFSLLLLDRPVVAFSASEHRLNCAASLGLQLGFYISFVSAV
jgi:hypothetical protein